MYLSPRLYHWLVRPPWFTRIYIHDHINGHFCMDHKNVLDFGSGTGANCRLCKPDFYLGIEPNKQRVGLAKRFYPDYSFELFDERKIPVRDHSIDYILVVAVLHHLNDGQIRDYLSEFDRVLKPGGRIIAMEPYLCDRAAFRNRLMNWYDDGEYIRNEESYFKLFQDGNYRCETLKKFTKCFVYNEIFFSAQREAGDDICLKPT